MAVHVSFLTLTAFAAFFSKIRLLKLGVKSTLKAYDCRL